MSNNNNKKLNITCPITHENISDPVSTPGGHTYEKAAIHQWVQQHNTSPLTQQRVTLADLKPNFALRELLEASNDGQDILVPANDELNAAAMAAAAGGVSPVKELDVAIQSNDQYTVVQVRGPDQEGVPCAVSLVIDISGSMDTQVSVKHADGSVESHGLTQLDITKHGAKTIVKNLRPYDLLSLVTYSDNARVELPLTKMDGPGQQLAMSAIEAMRTEGMTNLFAGVRAGLEEVCKAPAGYHRVAMVLTDGMSNVNPPSGIMPSLRRLKEKINFDCTIDTFGFGYSLDSQLLAELAAFGSGSFSFIPDGTMVGTVFINSIANTLTTIAKNVCVCVQDADDDDQFRVLGGYPATKSGGVNIRLGTLRAGQALSTVFSSAAGPQQQKAPYVCVTYDNFGGAMFTDQLREINGVLDDELGRLMAVDKMHEALTIADTTKQYARASELLQTFGTTLRDDDVRRDVCGQAAEALSTDAYFNRWGKHYLRSLLAAHLQCRANNFKDGVQRYGGQTFKQIREKCEDVFLTLPAPTPSARAYQGQSVSAAAFSGYYNSSGVCFAGSSQVAMHNGAVKLVRDLHRHDVVATPDGRGARVQCLVETVNYTGAMCALDDGRLHITPWHPVLKHNKWAFPAMLCKQVYQNDNSSVYNLVLDSVHVVLLNGIEVCTLGHGFTDDQVIEHGYFGTQRVIDDLKTYAGWEDGHVRLQAQSVKRDPTTKLVTSI